MDSSSRNRIVHILIEAIYAFEWMKTRFYSEIILREYTGYIPGISTGKEYAWYIPGIYQKKTFWGFQMPSRCSLALARPRAAASVCAATARRLVEPDFKLQLVGFGWPHNGPHAQPPAARHSLQFFRVTVKPEFGLPARTMIRVALLPGPRRPGRADPTEDSGDSE
jgi:hypothetical protein